MKIKLNRIHIFTGFAVLIAASLIYMLGYYLLITPAAARVNQLENQLDIQKDLIAESSSISKDFPSSSAGLQQKLPVGKAMDHMLVDIKQIASQSETAIHHLSLVPVKMENAGASEDPVLLPEGVERVNFYMNATVENYQQMHEFLDGLTGMDRLIDINLIQFGSEVEGRLDFSVSFYAFYAPSLSALIEEAPEEVFPNPAGRESPFQN